jgi:hypothetical protein
MPIIKMPEGKIIWLLWLGVDLISTTIIFCQILSELILRLNGIVVLCSRLEVISSLALKGEEHNFST